LKIRVLVAEDHVSIRKELGVAANGPEAIRLVDAVEPDVAVIDISMPELNGIEAIQQMLPEHPNL
jgi:YesN/AraC family two-component response regulator